MDSFVSNAGGNVEIRYNLKLTDISGLSNLEVIGGEVAGPGRGKAVDSPAPTAITSEHRIDL